MELYKQVTRYGKLLRRNDSDTISEKIYRYNGLNYIVLMELGKVKDIYTVDINTVIDTALELNSECTIINYIDKFWVDDKITYQQLNDIRNEIKKKYYATR
jgi:hypothetical protein